MQQKQAPKTYSNCSHCGPEGHAAVRKRKHPKRTHCSHCGPERPAAVLKSKHPKSILIVDIRTAAGLSGPQWLQLEYVLGACFSLLSFSLLFFLFPFFPVFSPKLSTFWVLLSPLPLPLSVFSGPLHPLFRTAACLSGPYVLGACFSGPLHLSGPQWLQLEYVLGACCSGPLHVFPDRERFGCLLYN